MTFPAPRPGLVIRYSFLWSDEQRTGSVEGAKDRPCAIVVAARRWERGDIRVLVAPITHSPPDDPDDSLEIPAPVAKALGLDGKRHWLRLDELNRFSWPGYDLRPIPGMIGRYDYGMLPVALFEALKQGILRRQRVKRGRTQDRD
ncbi:MAG: hypothetical protein ACREEB_05845 [Caulobacteraceae bacterium]